MLSLGSRWCSYACRTSGTSWPVLSEWFTGRYQITFTWFCSIIYLRSWYWNFNADERFAATCALAGNHPGQWDAIKAVHFDVEEVCDPIILPDQGVGGTYVISYFSSHIYTKKCVQSKFLHKNIRQTALVCSDITQKTCNTVGRQLLANWNGELWMAHINPCLFYLSELTILLFVYKCLRLPLTIPCAHAMIIRHKYSLCISRGRTMCSLNA